MTNLDSKHAGKVLKRANPATIQDKFLVGYQGWFTCAGDGEPVAPGHHGWLHWFDKPIPDGGRPNLDIWPDVSSCSPSELFPAPGLVNKDGEQMFLFSSRNPKTVQRHFHWMAEHGVDGAFLQRFVGQSDVERGQGGIMRIRDEVTDRVVEAAEREGRVFAIMYDVAGVPPDRIQPVIERDWAHLIRDKSVLDSPCYLKENGRPVVALWGFGFAGAGHTPELLSSITSFFRRMTPGGVYIMAGTPAHWRTAQSDADPNPAFLNVWLKEFDAISPWTVGRYKTERDVDSFAENKMRGDIELIKKHAEGSSRKIDYIPVVLPGGSGFNLSEGKWAYNDMKRNGGRFLWRQLYNAHRLGVRTMYGAMWDEYDEGTAFMPVVPYSRMLPKSDKFPFMALDEDGYDLPSDWYMRICGFAGEALRKERRIDEMFPVKELQDYWATRPRYEDVENVLKAGHFVSGFSGASGSGSEPNDAAETSTGGQSYEEWLATQRQKEEGDDVPPPPYSLESEAEAPVAPIASAVPAPVLETRPSNAAPSNVAPSNVPPSNVQNIPVQVQLATNHSPAPVVTNPVNPAHGASAANQSTYQNPASAYYQPVTVATGFTNNSALTAQSQPGGYTPTSSPNQQPSPSNLYAPGVHIQTSPADPMVSLSDDFSRQGISRPGPTSPGTKPLSPPPTHPMVANSRPPQTRPQTRPDVFAQNYPHPNSQTRPNSRPNSQSGPANPQVPVGATHSHNSSSESQQTSGSWSQGQWPPPEWKTNVAQQNQGHSGAQAGSAFGNSGAGANLVRPSTYHANATSPSPSLRPTNLGGSPIPSSPRPPSSHSYPSSPSPNSPGPTGFSTSPSASPFASSFSMPNEQSYSMPQSTNPSHNRPYGSNAWPRMPGSTSPPHSPPLAMPGPNYYTGPSNPYNPSQISTYPGGPSHSPLPPIHNQGPGYFPQPGGYNPPYQAPTYPGHHDSNSSYQAPSQNFSYPQPSTSPGSWTPAGQGQPVPPPRPSNYSSSVKPQNSSNPAFPGASGAGASALNLALGAVDKVAGRKTREQLESGVGSLAQTGSKLFNKFK